MKTYHVRVAVRVLEIWEVEAENAEDAMATWDDGKLIHTSDEALDTETLSAKEESHAHHPHPPRKKFLTTRIAAPVSRCHPIQRA